MRHAALFTLLLALSTPQVSSAKYAEWLGVWFTPAEQANPLISGETADPDRDGIPNLYEYGHGSNPRQAGTSASPVQAAASGGLTLQWPRAADRDDLDFIVEASTDGVTWTAGLAGAWTTDAVPGAGGTMMSAVSLLPASARQFLRLRVEREPRAGLRPLLASAGNSPADMMTQCVVPSGPLKDGIVQVPIRAPLAPNYKLNWYFANLGLYSFVKTHPAMVKAYLQLYVSRLNSSYQIADVDIYSSNWSVWQTYRADSDDAYAGTFLRLASAYRRAWPADPWFAANLATLKNIAYYNIVTQVKPFGDPGYGLTRAHQAGTPSNVGFLMDNVEAWAGLAEFTTALTAIADLPAEIAYYGAFRDGIRDAIHRVLWHEPTGAWRANDIDPVPGTGPFYPALQCQLYPELYGLPHPDTREQQRRFNQGWKWMADHMPGGWWTTGAWPAADQFSHLDIAAVAAKRGETQRAGEFLEMARQRWLPIGANSRGTIVSEVGKWNELLNP